METTGTQPKSQEVHLQECAIETVSDTSLPAAQVIHEQIDQAEHAHASCFIP